jgi:hypothetical protein
MVFFFFFGEASENWPSSLISAHHYDPTQIVDHRNGQRFAPSTHTLQGLSGCSCQSLPTYPTTLRPGTSLHGIIHTNLRISIGQNYTRIQGIKPHKAEKLHLPKKKRKKKKFLSR